MYYQEAQKKAFLKDTQTSWRTAMAVFGRTAPIEIDKNKDISQFQKAELESFFSDYPTNPERALLLLREYNQWCAAQGFQTTKDIFQIKTPAVEKAKKRMVSSPKHLALVLNQLFAPVEEETIDCLYHCFYWLAFLGIAKQAEALEVRADEVNFDELLIQHQGKSYEIYPEAVPALQKAAFLTEFNYIHPGYHKNIRKKRIVSPYLFRGLRMGKLDTHSLYSNLNHKLAQCQEKRISYSPIYSSGIFYRVFQLEQAGFPANFSEIIQERVAKANKTSSLDQQINIKSRNKKLANSIDAQLKQNYHIWQIAFSDPIYDLLRGSRD